MPSWSKISRTKLIFSSLKVDTLRKFLATLASIILLPTLVACASSSSAAACATYTSGTDVKKVSATGGQGEKPTVSISGALQAKEIETNVITEGNGPTFTGAQMIKFDYVIVNGTTGKEMAASAYDAAAGGEPQFFGPGQSVDMCHALSGVKEGSRVAILIPAGLASQESTDELKVTDSVVFLLDIHRVYLGKIDGTQRASENGMPTVVVAPSGQPGVTMPGTQPPSEFKMNTLVDGTGETISKGDTVTVNYSGFLWATGAQFDSSWTNGAPVQFQITDGGLIPGFVKALTGAKVGSRLLAVIPPAEGYGAEGNSTIPGNSTLVFVVDVLGVDKAAK